MTSNRENLKNEFKSALNKNNAFSSLSPIEQERLITQMNTIGNKAEEKKYEASIKNSQTGMMNLP